MATTPQWSAARSGLLGDTGAVDASAQINQFLGMHPSNEIYAGNSILTPNGSGGAAWQYHLDAWDIAQPFTLVGTSVGRVVVPVLPVGTGADLIVSLCSNSSGAPGSVITQTRIPANWITSLSAVAGLAGPSSSPPVTQYTGNPLAVAQFNSFHATTTTTTSWPFPSAAAGVTLTSGSQATTGNYFITAGGVSGGTTYYSNVYVVQADGNGSLGQAIPQPSMPQVNSGECGMTVATDPASGSQTVVVAGGRTVPGSATNAVFTAQFNPTTGTLASWSTQASLPQALNVPVMTSWNGYVYVLGGTNAALNADVSTAYFAQVQNGQITAWTSGMPFPVVVDSMYAVAINGFLVAFGGENFNGSTIYNQCYYAAINADGSLGAWQTGPPMPASTTQFQTSMPTFGRYGVLAITNTEMLTLGFGANGPDTSWQQQGLSQVWFSVAAVPGNRAGDWVHYGVNATNYVSHTVSLTPRISIPLPATGLTNGATYHVVLSQPNGDLNNYLRTHDDFDVFSGNPTVLTRAEGTSTWVAGTTGHAVPMQIFDITAGGPPLHTWEDSGARISTLVYTGTPDRRLLGTLEAVMQPAPLLNRNPTFTTGIAPWHVTNGTFAQSNTFTHGNLPFSAKLTPNGTSSQAFAESDLVPIQQGHQYAMTSWYYSPTGYTNVSISANWFDVNRSYITTTSGTATSIAAGVWTQFQTTVTANVANAAFLDMVIIEGGTPPATAVLYASAATVQDTSGPQLSTVAQIGYPGTWPGACWPPLGVTALA